MVRKRFLHVHIGERVAGDDNKRVVFQDVERFHHTAGRAEGSVLDRIDQLDAELGAVAEVAFDLVGEIIKRDDDFVDTIALQQLDRVLHARLIANRHQRLGAIRCERPQACSFATGHNHGFHLETLPTKLNRPFFGKPTGKTTK